MDTSGSPLHYDASPRLAAEPSDYDFIIIRQVQGGLASFDFDSTFHFTYHSLRAKQVIIINGHWRATELYYAVQIIIRTTIIIARTYAEFHRMPLRRTDYRCRRWNSFQYFHYCKTWWSFFEAAHSIAHFATANSHYMIALFSAVLTIANISRHHYASLDLYISTTTGSCQTAPRYISRRAFRRHILSRKGYFSYFYILDAYAGLISRSLHLITIIRLDYHRATSEFRRSTARALISQYIILISPGLTAYNFLTTSKHTISRSPHVAYVACRLNYFFI
jgi:hypothetical protein